MRPKVLVAGNMNMDVLAEAERVPLSGENLRCSEIRLSPGGKAANQSVAAARLGAEVVILSATGRDALSDTLIDNLKSQGVDVLHVRRSHEKNCGLAIVIVDARGENRILSHLGANELLSADDVDSANEQIKTADVVMVQLGISRATVERVIDQARQFGKTVIVDPTPLGGWLPTNIAKADFILPNETEFALIRKQFSIPENDFPTAASLLAENGIRNVILKLGPKGVVWLHDGQFEKFQAYTNVKVKDTTGAGDCFSAAFAVEYAHTQSVQKAIRFACVAAALATTKIGAQSAMPVLDEVKAELENWNA